MVRLSPYDPQWPDAFEREAAAIRGACAPTPLIIHHIGSTSIPGLTAKPIIDMLGAAPAFDDKARLSDGLRALGYEAMGAFGIEGRLYFRKDDAAGERTHHLHLFRSGSPHVARHLAFRDYLRAHPERAAAYAALKADLVARGAHYVDGKEAFVKALEAEALGWRSAII